MEKKYFQVLYLTEDLYKIKNGENTKCWEGCRENMSRGLKEGMWTMFHQLEDTNKKIIL